MVKFEEGDVVMVYDRYRFAIPLKAEVCELSSECEEASDSENDGDEVRVRLITSNNPHYPVGHDKVWVHKYQLKLTK